MKSKPKKLAALLELDKQELKYLLAGVEQFGKNYIQYCSRDFASEELHDKIKNKLETAISSFD